MKKFKDYFKKKKWRFGLILFISVILFSFNSYAGSVRDVIRNIEQVQSIAPSFQFAVIGDSRDGEKVYTQLIQAILERKPDFIIHLGDMIAKPDEKEWRQFFEISKSISLPFFPVAGNHDVGTTLLGEEMYRKQFLLPEKRTYYAFRAGGSLFIILDSEKGKGKISDEQRQWLREILGSSSHAFKLVFLHRPLFLPADSFKKGRGMDKFPFDRDQLHQLFVEAKVNAVFAGDDHRYDRREKDGILYIISGGGGAPLHPFKERGGYFHYLWVFVQADRIEGEVVDLEGEVRDRFVNK
ncbi:MAG: metallophosphoesterase [Thermodesulfobacteriota bacterium]|nr:metallophosphoesterase [Thermodesulfobacteriota bacterium]